MSSYHNNSKQSKHDSSVQSNNYPMDLDNSSKEDEDEINLA